MESSIDYCNLDLSKISIKQILEKIIIELTTTSIHDCFIEYGKMRHHLKTIRCDLPIKEEMIFIISPRSQLNLAVIEIDDIRIQHYPKGRITDITDLRPTRPTYIADIVLYTRKPYIYFPKSLMKRFKIDKCDDN